MDRFQAGLRQVAMEEVLARSLYETTFGTCSKLQLVTATIILLGHRQATTLKTPHCNSTLLPNAAFRPRNLHFHHAPGLLHGFRWRLRIPRASEVPRSSLCQPRSSFCTGRYTYMYIHNTKTWLVERGREREQEIHIQRKANLNDQTCGRRPPSWGLLPSPLRHFSTVRFAAFVQPERPHREPWPKKAFQIS